MSPSHGSEFRSRMHFYTGVVVLTVLYTATILAIKHLLF